MRAIVTSAFGGPEALVLTDIPRPSPGVGEVLVRVVASGTNPVDAKIRAAGSWAGIPLPAVLGYDVSGVVEELGAAVTDLAVGDEVYFTPEIFGNRHGSYAEYTVAPASIVARKPRNLSHEDAAAIPLAGGTAWEALIRRLAVRPGETVLIHGGAGGVGSFGVQIARLAGARVIATAGPDNQDTLRALGADVAVDYRSQDVTAAVLRETDGRGVDAVFDTTGGDRVAASLACTRPGGRLATVLAPQGDLSALYPKNQTLHGVFLTRERRRLDELRPLFEQGRLRPLVESVLPLEAVAEAHRRLDSGHGRGKMVLRVG